MSELNSVLMVDDDETTIFLNKIFLQNLTPELEVNTADNGEEALDFLRAHLDDPGFGNCLLVLDIEMPIMDGWQFLEAYEKEFSDAQKEKVLLAVLSIHSTDEVKKRALKYASVKECLLKPLSDDQFRKVINRHFPNFLAEKQD
ncbi:response regulator [Allomuricauda sp. d1]|uniref:response regulator n=1 Tax=Allomuricauda sp. d1 TaxID=3136725 RepID=UPI0031DC0CB1